MSVGWLFINFGWISWYYWKISLQLVEAGKILNEFRGDIVGYSIVVIFWIPAFWTGFHIIDSQLQFFYFFLLLRRNQRSNHPLPNKPYFFIMFRNLIFYIKSSLNGNYNLITSTYFIFIWKTYTTLPYKLKSTGFGLILLKNTNKSFKFPLHKIPFNQPKIVIRFFSFISNVIKNVATYTGQKNCWRSQSFRNNENVNLVIQFLFYRFIKNINQQKLIYFVGK